MTRKSGVYAAALLVVAVVSASLLGGAGDPPLADDGAVAKTPAQLLVGTWTKASWDGITVSWWRSDRKEFRADGTFCFMSNDCYVVFRTVIRTGRYEVFGNTIRYHSPLTAEHEAKNARSPRPSYRQSWDVTIDDITATEFRASAGEGSEHMRGVYRRVN